MNMRRLNILTGVYDYDRGKIYFDGKEYTNLNIQQMEKAGIAFVHQELNVINDLTVYENIFAVNEQKKGPFVDWNKTIVQATELLQKVKLRVTPETLR